MQNKSDERIHLDEGGQMLSREREQQQKNTM